MQRRLGVIVACVLRYLDRDGLLIANQARSDSEQPGSISNRATRGTPWARRRFSTGSPSGRTTDLQQLLPLRDVAIVGSAGFIGTALAYEWAAHGARVVVTSRSGKPVAGAQAVRWDPALEATPTEVSNARLRGKIVAATRGRKRRSHARARAQALGKAHYEADHHRPTAPMTADCIAISIPFAMRADAIDLSICPHCGGRLRVIAGGRRRSALARMHRLFTDARNRSRLPESP